MSDWTIIDCSLDDLKSNGKILKFKNKTIALFKNDTNLMAFGNRCPHRGGSIGNGTMTVSYTHLTLTTSDLE